MDYELEINFKNDYEDETFIHHISESDCHEFARDVIKREAGLGDINNKEIDTIIDFMVKEFDLYDEIFRNYNDEAQDFFYQEAREVREEM